MAEGQLVRHKVMPITGVRGWGDRMEAHMDHAWLMMRSHAQGETRAHSGELEVVEVGGGGGDDARSHSSAGSRGSKALQGPEDGPPHPPPRDSDPSKAPVVI